MRRIGGLTIIETVIALGIAGMLAIMLLDLVSMTEKELKIIQKSTESVVDDSFARHISLQDFQQSTSSFNFLNLKGGFDDDLIVDSPYCQSIRNQIPYFWVLTTVDYCKGISFVMDNPLKKFHLLIFDQGARKRGIDEAKGSLLISPSSFYDVHYTNKGGANITFSNKKIVSVLKAHNIGNNDAFFKLQAIVQTADSNGNLKDYSMLAGFTSNQLSKINVLKNNIFPPLSNHCTVKADTNVDSFLRCLPASGAMASVFIIPVRYVTYKLEKPKNSTVKGYNLVRSVLRYEKGQLVWKDILIAQQLEKVVFSRKHTSSLLIDVDLQFIRQ